MNQGWGQTELGTCKSNKLKVSRDGVLQEPWAPSVREQILGLSQGWELGCR